MNKDISYVVDLYGISSPISCVKIHDGIDNNVYIIERSSKEKSVLRESKRSNERKDIDFEIELLLKLKSVNFKSAKLLATKTGQYKVSLDAATYTMFEFIQGSKFEQTDTTILTQGVITTGSKALGDLHQHTRGIMSGAKSVRNIFTELERILKIDSGLLKQFMGYDALLSDVLLFYKEAEKKMAKETIPLGVIHNDYRIQNLIYKNASDCYIIDFDWACNGPLIKDVALAVGEWSLFDYKNSVPNREAINSFLMGYNSASPIEINYDSNLLFWMCFAYLSEASTFFVDICESRYPDLVITNVEQCYSLKKFKYFNHELHNFHK